MNYDDERSNLIFKFVITMVILFLIFAGLIWYIYHTKIDARILESERNLKQTQKSIDSLSVLRLQVINTISKESQSRADRANEITNSITNDKITIRDTTYDAMCQYLTNYRP